MKLIVDLFNQHGGDFAELKRAALVAWQSGADIVKIQILNSRNIWGDDSREYLEMTRTQVWQFSEFCKQHTIPWAATVFDENGLSILKDHISDVALLKIASCTTLNDVDFAKKIIALAEHSRKDVLVSSGMSKQNIKEIFKFGTSPNLHYMFCISKYPVEYEEISSSFPQVFCQTTTAGEPWYSGYSDHSKGNFFVLDANSCGASYIEKHFTFDQLLTCSTEKAHICSFTPESLRSFKNSIRRDKK